MLTIEAFVQREVVQCVSSLVSTLANGSGCVVTGYTRLAQNQTDLANICDQALELASPVDDWEEGLLSAGYESFTDQYGAACWVDKSDGATWAGTAQSLCEADDIEPHYREVFEHWSITPWLAERLIAHGEKVDLDFAGMCVWARTTAGQQISADYVIGEIYRDLMAS